MYLALDQDLEILPVVNKIDLPSARPEEVKAEIEDYIGLDASDAPLISAKNGINIEDVLEGIVNHVPAPEGDSEAPLKALIFDSYYDAYKGVIAYVRVFEGTVKKGMTIEMMNTKKKFEVTEVGVMAPNPTELPELSAGDVGYIAASIKDIRSCRVGDTITDADNMKMCIRDSYKTW